MFDKKINIFLLGRSLSDKFQTDSKNFQIVGKYHSSSFSSLSTPPLNLTDSELSLKTLDTKKRFFHSFFNSDSNILLMDLLDEIFDVAITSTGGSFTLHSTCNVQAAIGGELHDILSKSRWPMWCKGIRRLFNLIDENKYLGFVFINKIFLKNDGSSKIEKINATLEKMYSYIEKEFPKKAIMISLPNNLAIVNDLDKSKYSYALERQEAFINIVEETISPVKIKSVDVALERIISNELNFQNGLLLVEKELIKLEPFQSQPFKVDELWITAHSNRSWLWRLNWFSFIPYLIAYHARTNKDEALDLARDLISEWIELHLFGKDVPLHEFIWHDHGTALRIEQCVFLFFYIKGNVHDWELKKENSNFLYKIVRILYLHGFYLEEDSFYSKHTNHGLEQSRVLLFISQTIKNKLISQRWRNISIGRISSELEYSFTSEGVHVENSPGYHIFVFKVFLSILSEYSSTVLGDLNEKFLGFSNKSLEFISRIIRPDALLPILGDTEHITTTDGYANLFKNSMAYSYFKYATTKGKVGFPPTQVNKVYPQSGYAIFRDDWHTHEEINNTIHIIIKSGCLSQYHHQQDEGNILLYAYGTDWLIDSGLYNYNHKDTIRRYMRSRYAHNVPIISGSKYRDEFEHRTNNWKIVDFNEGNSEPYVSMHINVLKDTMTSSANEFSDEVSHLREVSFDKANRVMKVSDKIYCPDGDSKRVDFLWHVPIDKKITNKDGLVEINDKNGTCLTLTIISKARSSINVYKGGDSKTYCSYTSARANSYEDSQVIVISFYVKLDISVDFIFSFHDQYVEH
ncbi:heparinase II/III domain-containing protein [Aeromonas rivipollensis]|uniref:heparinase II/III domain-containing protein n=1 Tax=Aeromonas rivipollensis TaxID=948519 RepID=UPI003D263504